MNARRRLGRSDIEITPIGLGCWQFSGGKGVGGAFWDATPPSTMDAIVAASLRGGVNWFDTAEVYGNGRSEKALAHALHAAGQKNGEVVVATKWWPILRTAANIGATIGDRLRCLGGFGIDLHQVHFPHALSSIAAQMRAMADLVAAGQIRTDGLSNFSARAMRTAHAALASHGLPLVSNQVRYSLLHRRIEDNGVLATARELGITIIAYSPLAQGILTGKYHQDPTLIRSRSGPRKWMPSFRGRGLAKSRAVVEELRRIATAHGATPSQIALAWVVQMHGDAVVAIPGASSVRQAEENAAAMALELTADERARLDVLSQGGG